MMVPIGDNVRFVVLQDGAAVVKLDDQKNILTINEVRGSAHGLDANLIALIRSRNPNARIYTVTGKSRGETVIVARDAKGKSLATIDVSAKQLIEKSGNTVPRRDRPRTTRRHAGSTDVSRAPSTTADP